MQMRPEIQIASIIKAMKEVVMPAIDPANRPAVEQSQLIIGLLSLLSSQLPVQFRFDLDELARLATSAAALNELAAGEPGIRAAAEKLSACQTRAADIVGRCTVEPADLTASVRELRAAISETIRSLAGTANLDAQLQAEKIVLDMSREQLLRDRSLMKLQGWEADPAQLPAIETLLAEVPGAV